MPTYRNENLNMQAKAFLPIALDMVRDFFECTWIDDEESFEVRYNPCYNGRERGYCLQVVRMTGFMKDQMNGIVGVRFFFAEEKNSDRLFIESWGVAYNEICDDLLARAPDDRRERAWRTRPSFAWLDYRDASKHFRDKLEEYVAPLANADEDAA